MKRAENVTFGTSGLDRDGQLRGDAEAIGTLLYSRDAGLLPLWRGKPLLRCTPDEGPAALGWLEPDHPALAGTGPPIFLGRDGASARFAVDLSGWTPNEIPETLGGFSDCSRQHHPQIDPAMHFAELRGAMLALSPRDAELAATARGLVEWHRTHPHCARCGARSVPAEAGWQRVCPDCGARHFPRTDPVAIMLVTRGNAVLVGRAPGWPERMYSLLAGFIEPGETIETAVRRETFEETGIRIGDVRYLASQPWPFPASLMIGCHGIATSHEITLDPSEIEAAEWVSREEMMDVFAGAHPRINGARPGAIAHFLLSNWLADTLD